MSKLKVLRVSSLPTMLNPGAGLAALHLSNWKSFSTTVFSYNSPDSFLGAHDFNLNLLNFDNPTMPKKRSGLLFWVLQLKRINCLLFFFLRFCLKAKSKDVNIIHIHSPLHILIVWWGMIFKIPSIVSIHGTDSIRILDSRFYKFLFSPVKHIFCVSSIDVEKFHKVFPKSHVHLISNGVNYRHFRPLENHSEENTIIACGSLRWHKDFETLITACHLTFAVIGGWNLKIIGEGPDRSKLERLVSSYGLEKQISLIGVIDRNLLAEYFRKAKIFVISSVTEGLPKVLLEAMASNCACIATDVGDCRRILNHCGLVVPKQNPQQLSDALLKLMTEEDIRVGLADAGQLVASGYSWDNYCRHHDQIYRSILNRK